MENTIRPLALNRKNALFAGHDEGAAAWARIASLVETAKMNQVNPHAYLKATLEAIGFRAAESSRRELGVGVAQPRGSVLYEVSIFKVQSVSVAEPLGITHTFLFSA